MIESPTKPVAASPDDRPIVVGRFDQPDYYVLAHEAKSRGDHSRAVTLLAMAARDLGVDVFITGDVLIDWDCHIEAVDRAWGKELVLLDEAIEPVPNRLVVNRVPKHELFIDAVMAKENDRPVCAAVLLRIVAESLGIQGDWTGTWGEDWTLNFDAVHTVWEKKWSHLYRLFEAARDD